jgi:hypothetical protein
MQAVIGLLESFEPHRKQHAEILQKLLAASAFKFDAALEAQLPLKPGLYVIATTGECGHEYLHAGASPKRKEGLRGRIWNDHFQYGNTGSDLVQQVMDKHKLSRDDARVWIARNCLVQWLVEEETDVLCWAEHYMLSLLRPIWCR